MKKASTEACMINCRSETRFHSNNLLHFDVGFVYQYDSPFMLLMTQARIHKQLNYSSNSSIKICRRTKCQWNYISINKFNHQPDDIRIHHLEIGNFFCVRLTSSFLHPFVVTTDFNEWILAALLANPHKSSLLWSTQALRLTMFNAMEMFFCWENK